ncbi:hypothetical protein Agabi119p4_5374 [Agaricus bisporus var. burnettii]|uniref:Uncharacterized protein n=1 Tax=Agaricus bisporus var. burnettii TaxID=192524 RepID=A0A8H7F1L0_AGABI|nr:hypothetical protein Agabi119p4_5374 [Agaricus bisporus var. burnettii]
MPKETSTNLLRIVLIDSATSLMAPPALRPARVGHYMPVKKFSYEGHCYPIGGRGLANIHSAPWNEKKAAKGSKYKEHALGIVISLWEWIYRIHFGQLPTKLIEDNQT